MSAPDLDSQQAFLSTHRVEALQDGVFAIVLTILVLELHIPDVATAQELSGQLWNLEPTFVSYLLSFINLGVYWVAVHNQYHYIKMTDRVLLWINLAFLLFISVLPFTTALLGRYSAMQLPYILYGLNLIVIGLIGFGHWCYATKHHRLTDHSISPLLVQGVKRRILVAPIVCAVAILASFFSMRVSLLFYLILPPYYIWPGKVDKFWRQPAIPHED